MPLEVDINVSSDQTKHQQKQVKHSTKPRRTKKLWILIWTFIASFLAGILLTFFLFDLDFT